MALDALRSIHEQANQPLLALVGNHRRVLDVGCGYGENGAALRARGGVHVTGLTVSPIEAQAAEARLDEVRLVDLEAWEPEAGERWEALVLSHVLEHLADPWSVLARLVDAALVPGGRAYVALPNALVWQQRWQLLRGHFRYAAPDEGGLMDRSHLRWFDARSARELVEQAGLRLIRFTAPGYVPLPGLRRLLPRRLQRLIDHSGSRLLPGLLGQQFLLVGERPS